MWGNITMTTVRIKSRLVILGALVISGVILVMPARGRAQVSGAPEVQAAIPGSQSASAGYVSPSGGKTLKQRGKSIVERLTPERVKPHHDFKLAAATFPTFSKHWEQHLRHREAHKLNKLNL